jgi:hypothetical protein
MRKWIWVFVLQLLAATPGHAGVHWLCGLSEDSTQLVCVADTEPTAALAEPEAATTTVKGTRFPLDARRSWRVNFWSPATDMAHVEQLARATICYRSPGCQLSLAATPQRPGR